MKKRIVINALKVMCIMFIAGLFLIFSAPSIGRYTGDAAVKKNGGIMDTSQFEKIIDSTTVSYQIGGFVISFFGGIGLITGGYVLYKEL